ncbi:Uu.00g024190.m01.CDS01 [Anthostomella pinea]|uniref:Uu.00g024190.m01.CDS01 n=1 Tax=Anthostomella pinea TaxID=933095 RepID=A0AAI8YR44_9PEZI|nr:Uu.00g024190.m01.CDS01 [Anthostomella pinea]
MATDCKPFCERYVSHMTSQSTPHSRAEGQGLLAYSRYLTIDCTIHRTHGPPLDSWNRSTTEKWEDEHFKCIYAHIAEAGGNETRGGDEEKTDTRPTLNLKRGAIPLLLLAIFVFVGICHIMCR